MRIAALTNDNDIKRIIMSLKSETPDLDFEIINDQSNPLEVMTFVIEKNPSLILIDDDYSKPNTIELLKALSKVKKHLHKVFLTDDESLELGREVVKIGVDIYLVKPVEEEKFIESIKSMINLINKDNSQIN